MLNYIKSFFAPKSRPSYTIEEIQSIINEAIQNGSFRYYIGIGWELAAGTAELIGLKNYARTSSIILSGKKEPFKNDLLIISNFTHASFQCLCIDDGERHLMRNFVQTTNLQYHVDNLPTLKDCLIALDRCDISDLDLEYFKLGEKVHEWLQSIQKK